MSPATLLLSPSASASPNKLHTVASAADAFGTKGEGTLIAMTRKDAPGAAPTSAVHDAVPAAGNKKRKADPLTASAAGEPTAPASPHKVNGLSAGPTDDLTLSLKARQRIEALLADPIKFVKDHRRNANETTAALAAKGIHPVNVPLSQNEGGAQANGAPAAPAPSTSAGAESGDPPSSKEVWNPISAHGGERRAASEISPVLTARQKEKARSTEAREEDDEAQQSPSSSAKAARAAVTPASPAAGFRPDDLYPFHLRLDWPSNATISTGLGNHGNTCYMNSTLQALLHTPPLVEILLNPQKLAYIVDQHSRNIAGNPSSSPFSRQSFGSSPSKGRNGYSNGVGGGGGKFNLLAVLSRLADSALVRRQPQGGGGGYHNKTIWPRQLSDNLSAFAKGLRKGRQEDAHEFLRLLLESLQSYCLDGLDEKTRNTDRVKNSTFVHRIFGGRFRSRVTCTSCRHPSDTFDTFLDISLDINKRNCSTLSQALRHFTAPDIISGADKYKCEKCKRPVDAVKQFTIDAAPPILTVQLKRFGLTGRKITRSIEFPDKLDISSFLSDPSRPGSKKANQYHLYAIIHHHGGGPNSGHYVASVKNMSGKWQRMDDDLISRARFDNNDPSAYILFYMRDPAADHSGPGLNSAAAGIVGGSKDLLRAISTADAQRQPFQQRHPDAKRKASDSLQAAHSMSSPAMGTAAKKLRLENGRVSANARSDPHSATPGRETGNTSLESFLAESRAVNSSPAANTFFGGPGASMQKFNKDRVDFSKPPSSSASRQALASSPLANGAGVPRKVSGAGFMAGTAKTNGAMMLQRKSLNASNMTLGRGSDSDDDNTEEEDIGAAIDRGTTRKRQGSTDDSDSAFGSPDQDADDTDDDYHPGQQAQRKGKGAGGKKRAPNGRSADFHAPSEKKAPRPGLHNGMKKREM